MKTLVTAKMNPDLENFSSCLAYASFLCQTRTSDSFDAKFKEKVSLDAEYMAKITGLSPEKYILKPTDDKYKSYILLGDDNQREFPKRVIREDVIERIDNIQHEDFVDFPYAQYQYEKVASIATLIAEKYFFSRSATISSENGILLLAAICLGTGNFKSSSTTFRDIRMKNWLIEEEKIDVDICKRMLNWRSDFIENFLEEVVKSEIKQVKLKNGKKFRLLELLTMDAENLAMRKDELLRYINAMKGKEDSIILIQDVKKGTTRIISTNDTFYDILRNIGFGGKKLKGILQTEKLVDQGTILSHLI